MMKFDTKVQPKPKKPEVCAKCAGAGFIAVPPGPPPRTPQSSDPDDKARYQAERKAWEAAQKRPCECTP
jgi:hypothetical protein